MKTIGLLGGMSWESTTTYYKLINEGVKEKLGGFHSAKIVLYSVDFDEIEKLQSDGNWDAAAAVLIDAARKIQAGGADFLLICTNTMHKVVSAIEQSISIPILHIADATAEALMEKGVKKAGLLGTRFTMEEEFYKGRISDKYGIEVAVPTPDDRETVHNVIYNELCLGKIIESSRREFLRIIESLSSEGAEAIILGCTEIASLVQQKHTDVPLFDTTAFHAGLAVESALSDR